MDVMKSVIKMLYSLRSSGLEGAVLHRGLFLKKVAQEDFKSNFTCVVTNAVGAVHKVIQLTKTSHCNKSRKPKRRMNVISTLDVSL